MKRLLILSLIILIAVPVFGKDEPNNRMTIFILQLTRKEEILKKDAVLMANFLQSANPGDEIQCLTTTSDDVFFYQLPKKQKNPLQQRRAQKQAIAELTAFFVRLLKEPPPDDTENNVADAISLGLERFNVAAPYERMSLVVMSSGLQFDGVIDFRGAYPNGAWIIHELSPFSAIPRNMTKAKVDCLMIPQRSDYVNSHHKNKIRKWYQWLFDHKVVQLIGFTSDHQSASNILTRGAPAPRRSSTPINLNGQLELTEVGRLVTSDSEEEK